MSIICAVGRWLNEYKRLQRDATGTYLKELKVATESQAIPVEPLPDITTSNKRSILLFAPSC